MPFAFLDSWLPSVMKVYILDFNPTKPFICTTLASSFILPATKLFAPF